MEINYVDKFSLLTSERLSNKNIVVSKKLQFSLQSIKSIFSINKYNGKDKKFNSLFKNIFGFVTPSISKFNINDNQLALWVRSNSYFLISDEIKFKDLASPFEGIASITDQTGGWVILNIEGQACRSLFEKLLTVDLEGFEKGKVIRTSIAGINCFILCKSKFDQYNILCPISFYESMKSRLESLIKLI
jgi:heterotetrameric sarcosine oxidase gamma subunit